MRSEQTQQVIEIAMHMCAKHGIANIDKCGCAGLKEKFCNELQRKINLMPTANVYQVTLGHIAGMVGEDVPINDVWLMADLVTTIGRATLTEVAHKPEMADQLHIAQTAMYQMMKRDREAAEMDVLKRHSITAMKFSDATMEVNK